MWEESLDHFIQKIKNSKNMFLYEGTANSDKKTIAVYYGRDGQGVGIIALIGVDEPLSDLEIREFGFRLREFGIPKNVCKNPVLFNIRYKTMELFKYQRDEHNILQGTVAHIEVLRDRLKGIIPYDMVIGEDLGLYLNQ